LLDQASFHSSPVSLDVDSIIPALITSAEDTKLPLPPPTSVRKRKYALMQHLPTGNWWTSVNSDAAPLPADAHELTNLPTAHAEFVAVLPSASTSSVPQGTLAAYAGRRTAPTVVPTMPGPRQISCGRFLDYGPYASFAPCFDQDGVEVGRNALGEVIWYEDEKRRLKERAKGKQRATSGPRDEGGDVVMSAEASDSANAGTQSRRKQEKMKDPDVSAALEGLLSPEDVAAVKSALGTLELEIAVQELLDRNARALARLEELQLMRLGKDDGGTSKVEHGSEEWDVAQGIMDSLTLLTSLRPRSSSDDSPPLIPPASVLQKLHRTLPVEATQGWYGTLPEGRITALRDDTTINVKSGVPIPVAAATPAATVAPVAKAVAPVSTPYTLYPYPNYPGAQYRGGYGTYTPGQANTFYQNHPPQAGQSSTAPHYPNQQYAAAGQHQYQYSSWYNYQTPAAQSAAGSSSGRATPQPAAGSPLASNYASFFAQQAPQPQPQPQRAVANTVLAATGGKAYQGQGAWGGQGYAAPTLPPHMRTAMGGASTPGTPPPPTTPIAGSSYPPQGYYSGYQATPSAAR
ncbi:hypothetical protein B0H21DRAFT_694088, partial [Amylocystis lapponica]